MLKATAYSNSGTKVGGYISEDTAWTLEGSPYNFVDEVTIAEGTTLTIEPGVVINFDLWRLKVDGTLRAIGNESHKIIMYSFQEPLDKSWARIDFEPTSKPWNEATGTGCIIEHCLIWFSYHTDPIIKGGYVKISHNKMCINQPICSDGIISNNTIIGYYVGIFAVGNCSILYNVIKGTEYGGIYLGISYPRYPSDTDSPTIVGNLIIDNQRGITLSGWWGKPYIANNTITRNTYGFYLLNASYSNAIYNNVYNNSYNVYVDREDPRITVNMTYNWWGTTNTTIIEQKIYDQRHNIRLWLVNYTPFLDSEAKFPIQDSSPPQISTPKRQPEADELDPSQWVDVMVNVTDNFYVDTVILSYSHDGGLTWTNLIMASNEMIFGSTHHISIPPQNANTIVKFKIIAYDFFENHEVEDNKGEYYVYKVIPEFSSTMILLLLMVTTLITTILLKKIRKNKNQPTQHVRYRAKAYAKLGRSRTSAHLHRPAGKSQKETGIGTKTHTS
jgi:parallel beta-helix repeat protein